MALKLLDKLRPGEKGTIAKIRGKPHMHRRLSRMGLVIGRFIHVENASSCTDIDPIAVSTGRLTLCVDLIEAASVHVDLTKVR